MNIEEELLRDHSLPQAKRIAAYACLSADNFSELMKCFLSADKRISQRAAWSVSHAARHAPQLVKPHIGTLAAQLTRTDVHNAIIRNALRVLQEVDIPEPLHGHVLNACFSFVESHAAPAAIKAFSLTILGNLSRVYPELKQELKALIEDQWDNETPAFKVRAKKIIGK